MSSIFLKNKYWKKQVGIGVKKLPGEDFKEMW